MAKQVALVLPKAVLEALLPGTNLPRQWELVYLALESAKLMKRPDLVEALTKWLARMDELNKLKNELIKHERTRNTHQDSDASHAGGAS